jgi:hypothetical protein
MGWAMKLLLPRSDWQPPVWTAFALALVFAAIAAILAVLDRPAPLLAVLASMFTVCVGISFRRREPPSSENTVEELLEVLRDGIKRVKKEELPRESEATAVPPSRSVERSSQHETE